MMFTPRCDRRRGCGEGLLDQKPRKFRSRSRWQWLRFSIGMSLSITSFVPRDPVVKKQLYQEMLAVLRDGVRRKRSELWENHTSMFHHDNAPVHSSLLIRSYMTKHQTSVVQLPTYCPDLFPAEFILFPNVETNLKGSHFQTKKEIKGFTKSVLRAITESGFHEGLQ